MGKTHSKDVPTDQTLKGFNVIRGQSLIKKSEHKICKLMFAEKIYNIDMGRFMKIKPIL
jgi:hypothetical protein